MGSMTYYRAMLIRAEADRDAYLSGLPLHARRNFERAEEEADQ